MSNFPPIIGLSGKQYSGKDTLADWLLEAFPVLEKRPLALSIKQTYAQEHSLTLSELEANKAAHRHGLITLGNLRRAENPDYWLLKTFGHPLKEGKQGAIISDMRLRRELKALKHYKSLLIRVEADRDVRLLRGSLVAEDDPTECDLDGIINWPLRVENNGNLADFRLGCEVLIFPIVRHYLQSRGLEV
jgi:phosphomevalonate kinase